MAAMELRGGGGAAKEAAAKPLTAEEEALKRNTDCVYFLASPLTCKKGSECEYRHSDGARVNPRDCWYWMNGNCLNPKCSFRHPPLDDLYGPPGTSLPLAQLPSTDPQCYNNVNKQNVPCYYFHNGGCMKGERCPFMHGTQPAGNPELQTNGSPVHQQAEKVPTSSIELQQMLKKDSRQFKVCNMQQPKLNLLKPTESPSPQAVKAAVNAEVSSSHGLLHIKGSVQHPLQHELPRSQPTPVVRGRQNRPMEEHVQNGHETEEFLAESSPGFDVLVDGDAEDPEYHKDEDEYRRGSIQSGKTRNLAHDFDFQHSDYERMPRFERDRLNDEVEEYDQNGRVQGRHSRKHQRRSSDTGPDRPVILQREKTMNEIDQSDLRYRLKQRRLANSRSAVSPDRRHGRYHIDERYTEERRVGRTSSRDVQDYPHERSISNRLRGRITLPRSSPPVSVDLQSERERDRGVLRGRLSPARLISNSYEGRPQERIRRSRQNEEPARENTRNMREEEEFMDFCGPKSLAELKGPKSGESSHDQKSKELRNVKPLKSVVANQQPEGSRSFEGPKPLSVILKRKRETVPGTSAISGSEDENPKKGSETQQHLSSADKLENNGEEEEGLIHSGGEDNNDEQQSSVKEDIPETEEEGMVMDTMEEDLEPYEQRDGDYEYVIAEGGDFRAEDNEEYDEDDDDDDFAKKVGMMLS